MLFHCEASQLHAPRKGCRGKLAKVLGHW
jgi:hypothetical protein